MSAPVELQLQLNQESILVPTPEPKPEWDHSSNNKAWENLAMNSFERGIIDRDYYSSVIIAIRYAETHGRFFSAHSVFAKDEAGYGYIIFSDAGMLPVAFESQGPDISYDGSVLNSSKTMLAIKHLHPDRYEALSDYFGQDNAKLPVFVFQGDQVIAFPSIAIEKPNVDVFNRLNTYAEENFELMLQSYVYQYGLDDFVREKSGTQKSSCIEVPDGGELCFYEQTGMDTSTNALPSTIYSNDPYKLLQYIETLKEMQNYYMQVQGDQIMVPVGAGIDLEGAKQFVGVEYTAEEVASINTRIRQMTKEREAAYLQATLRASEVEIQATQQAVQAEVQAAYKKSLDLTLIAAGACVVLAVGIAYIRHHAKSNRPVRTEKVADRDYDSSSGITKPPQITIGEKVDIDGIEYSFDDALRLSSTDKTQVGKSLEAAFLGSIQRQPDKMISRTGLTVEGLLEEEKVLQEEENTFDETIRDITSKMREASSQINLKKVARAGLQPAELLAINEEINNLMEQHRRLELERTLPQESKTSVKEVRNIVVAAREVVAQVLGMNALQIEEEAARKLLTYLQKRALEEEK